ncbi:unnamed protein product [Lupinus luteus]|uniref:Reverse transcriptase domain-containing protein n=1 Tax=Lupinus luteus TaxID=3873 RepID=A0AAV1Y762_LUPLU
MPFGLCNAPATFQRCMLAIFADLVEKCIEVFMDDFSVFGDSFNNCLKNLETVLERCKNTNLILNWEKCHFMVTEGIVLGHKISAKGLEVDRAKIEVIEKLPPPTNIKGIRSFLGHAGFYRRFIKDFSKIAKPLCNLLLKESPFNFDNSCLEAFNLEFNLEIRDKSGKENQVADHLSRLKNENVALKEKEIAETFPDEKLFQLQERPWFADFANYKASGIIPEHFDSQQKNIFLKRVKDYIWDDPYLFKEGTDNIIRRCVDESEAKKILWHCHNSAYGGHYNGDRTAAKVLQSGKFKTKWTGPFVVKTVKEYGAIELEDPKTQTTWMVNGQRLKHYLCDETNLITHEESE